MIGRVACSGFQALDWPVIAQITQAGEILTLPVVVFISFLAQPRLSFAMARDGLLPSIMGTLDSDGNIFHGTIITGTQ